MPDFHQWTWGWLVGLAERRSATPDGITGVSELSFGAHQLMPELKGCTWRSADRLLAGKLARPKVPLTAATPQGSKCPLTAWIRDERCRLRQAAAAS